MAAESHYIRDRWDEKETKISKYGKCRWAHEIQLYNRHILGSCTKILYIKATPIRNTHETKLAVDTAHTSETRQEQKPSTDQDLIITP
jgi:hypothetical protein